MTKTCILCCIILDLQMVNISLRVLYRPDQRALPEIYRQLGLDYDDRVLPSICNEVRPPKKMCVYVHMSTKSRVGQH